MTLLGPELSYLFIKSWQFRWILRYRRWYISPILHERMMDVGWTLNPHQISTRIWQGRLSAALWPKKWEKYEVKQDALWEILSKGQPASSSEGDRFLKSFPLYKTYTVSPIQQMNPMNLSYNLSLPYLLTSSRTPTSTWGGILVIWITLRSKWSRYISQRGGLKISSKR